jgi:hypothetical protein
MHLAHANIHGPAALLPFQGEWHLVIRTGLLSPDRYDHLAADLAEVTVRTTIDTAANTQLGAVLAACGAAGLPCADIMEIRKLFLPRRAATRSLHAAPRQCLN